MAAMMTCPSYSCNCGEELPPDYSSSLTSVSPLSHFTPSPTFQDVDYSVNELTRLVDRRTHVATMDGCDLLSSGLCLEYGSADSSSSSRRLVDSASYRMKGLAIARPSNPSPTSLSSQQRYSATDSARDSALTPLQLIQPSRAYGNLPPRHIFVRRCNSPASSTFHAADQHPHPQRLQQELYILIQDYQNLQNSLAKLDEEENTRRLELLRTLAAASGDAKDVSFVAIVARLGDLRQERRQHMNDLQKIEAFLQRWTERGLISTNKPFIGHKTSSEENLHGQWFTLTKPTYSDCLGFNDDGDPLYRLGRMSFEMFFPGDLVCAIQAVFNPIMNVVPTSSKGQQSFSVPKTLQEEVKRALANDSGVVLRTYHIVVAFTVEPYSPSFGADSPNRIVSRPIKGIMTTYGYALPDPTTPDRLSVWFSGGKIACGEHKESREFQVWKEIFRNPISPHNARLKGGRRRSRRTFREGAMVFAAKMLMGATGYNEPIDEDTGEMRYTFNRPFGGHGKTYVDIMHLDPKIRVMRGHAGTIYAFARLEM